MFFAQVYVNGLPLPHLQDAELHYLNLDCFCGFSKSERRGNADHEIKFTVPSGNGHENVRGRQNDGG